MLGRMALSLAMLAPAAPAVAYSCALSADSTIVVVKTGNPDPRPKLCTVSCRFLTPDGPLEFSCTQRIPGGVKEWYVCVRSTGGRDLGRFEDGNEECTPL